jgi:hypothetical protein
MPETRRTAPKTLRKRSENELITIRKSSKSRSDFEIGECGGCKYHPQLQGVAADPMQLGCATFRAKIIR